MLSPKASWKYVVMNFSDSAQRLLRTPYRLAVRYTAARPHRPPPSALSLRFESPPGSRAHTRHECARMGFAVARGAPSVARALLGPYSLLSLHAFTLATVQPPL